MLAMLLRCGLRWWFPSVIAEIPLCSKSSTLAPSSLNMDTFSRFKMYKNVDEVLADLSTHSNTPEVNHLVETYNRKKAKFDEQRPTKKFPLIVLEGLDGSGKSSMSKRLASKMKARRWLTPPESIRMWRAYFDSNLPLRPAYYSLGNYIAALEVASELEQKPVIIDRFWHSTIAYALAQYVADHPPTGLPEPSDEIYQWPADLLKPDLVLFLEVSEAQRLQRHSRRNAELVTQQENLLKDDKEFREDVIRCYKNMREPKVTVVNADGSFGTILFFITKTVKSLIENYKAV